MGRRRKVQNVIKKKGQSSNWPPIPTPKKRMPQVTHTVLGNVTDKSTSTEEIRTTDAQFECPSTLPTELIGKFPLATASRSTSYQHYYRNISRHFIYGYISSDMVKDLLDCKRKPAASPIWATVFDY